MMMSPIQGTINYGREGPGAMSARRERYK